MTRNQQVAIILTQNRCVLHSDCIEPKEASAIMQLGIDSTEGFVSISTLTDRLEYLPLALSQAATYIRMNTIRVGKYVEFWWSCSSTKSKLLEVIRNFRKLLPRCKSYLANRSGNMILRQPGPCLDSFLRLAGDPLKVLKQLSYRTTPASNRRPLPAAKRRD